MRRTGRRRRWIRRGSESEVTMTCHVHFQRVTQTQSDCRPEPLASESEQTRPSGSDSLPPSPNPPVPDPRRLSQPPDPPNISNLPTPVMRDPVQARSFPRQIVSSATLRPRSPPALFLPKLALPRRQFHTPTSHLCPTCAFNTVAQCGPPHVRSLPEMS